MILENTKLAENLLERYKKTKDPNDLVILRKIIEVNVQKPLEDANLNFSKEEFNNFVDVVLEGFTENY